MIWTWWHRRFKTRKGSKKVQHFDAEVMEKKVDGVLKVKRNTKKFMSGFLMWNEMWVLLLQCNEEALCTFVPGAGLEVGEQQCVGRIWVTRVYCMMEAWASQAHFLHLYL
jgi:hypothetical protein